MFLVSILIILAVGGNKYQLLHPFQQLGSFNPHHTGGWLKCNSLMFYILTVMSVSILIILAVGGNYYHN